MSRRKNQEGKAIEKEQSALEQMKRAQLGTLYDFREVFKTMRIINTQDRALEDLRGWSEDEKKAIRDQFLLSKSNAWGVLRLWIEQAIAKGDSDAFRNFADLLDQIKSRESRSPLAEHLAHFRFEMERLKNNEPTAGNIYPFTTSKIKKWIFAMSGNEYPTNKIREVATQLGIPLAEGRGKGKKKSASGK